WGGSSARAKDARLPLRHVIDLRLHPRTGFRRGPQRILGGIGGGIAARTGISVLIVRIALLLLFLLPVLGWGAYLVVWVLTPNQSGSIPVERWLGRR
ncbi:PspC domain-containing protein, partial [Escherichia coli]|uniref:PspC domain-containing protein n=1 Tax=Escherichia coli TaxID=562 RepID=UPI001930F3A7